MREKKEDERKNSKNIDKDGSKDNENTDIEDIKQKADIKQEEEELRAWRRKIRIERDKEDKEWKKYRKNRTEFKNKWQYMSKDDKKKFKEEKKKNDSEWKTRKHPAGANQL